MPIAPRLSQSAILRARRVVLAIALALVTLAGALPAPAAALEPPRPLPGYRPTFVTETDTRPWTDCLWASAAMLLDKWTNGDVRVTRQALRAASGDAKGGSTFDDMKVAFAKYGFDVRFSPDGGDRVTWGQLLTRLSKGAGAVLLGDDHKLPRYYGRWDFSFWKARGKKDNHAVYVERYDAKRGRVWLMDPLGRGDWQGEWIPVWALRKFVWTRGDAVFAAVSPTAKAAPFAKVKAAPKPTLVVSSTSVDATWSIKAPKRWKFPGADVTATYAPAEDPLLAAALSPEIPTKIVDTPRPNGVTIRVQGRTMHLTAPLPTKPGAYDLHLGVRDKRFGRTFVTAHDLAIFVPGDRRATLRLTVGRATVEAGSVLKASVSVANSGTETWAGTWTLDAGSGSMTIDRGARAIARWIPLDEDASKAPAGVGEPIVLDAVPLRPGEATKLLESLPVPEQTGSWALAVDVVDDVDGSYAALGSRPSVVQVSVVVPRGREAAD